MSVATIQPHVPALSSSLETTPNAFKTNLPLGRADKYRGASVEDLQLPPAFCLSQSQLVARAIELAYERDYTHIPILNRHRRPLGYIDVSALKRRWEKDEINPDDQVQDLMNKFDRSAKREYTVITPLSPLEDLEVFLDHNLFALVTDAERKFVLAVATPQDLENFVTRRGSNF